MSSRRVRAKVSRLKRERLAEAFATYPGAAEREIDDGTDLDVQAAERDGAGCLQFLLNVRMDDLTFGDWCRRIQGGTAHSRVTRAFGLAIEPDGQWLVAAVATSHPFLAKVFATSFWCGDWSTPLLRLPGAFAGSRILFGQHYSPAILIPKALLFEAATSAEKRP